MKRSKKLRLAIIGIGGAAPLLLTGCGNSSKENSPLIYKDIYNCIKDGVFSEEICRLEYNKAWQNHLTTAPRYNNLNDCQFDFKSSSCQKLASGEYIPTMEGYLIYKGAPPRKDCSNSNDSHSIRRVVDSSLNVITVYDNNSPRYSQSQNHDSYHYGTSTQPKDSNLKQQASRSEDHNNKPKPSIKTTTMKRGGFGSKATARGSWGG